MLAAVIECIRQHEDQLLMRWEDDRGHLLSEIYRFQSLHDKDKKTRHLLQRQYDELAQLVLKHQRTDVSPQDIVSSLGNAGSDEATQDLLDGVSTQSEEVPETSRKLSTVPQEPKENLPRSSHKRRLGVRSDNALSLLVPPSFPKNLARTRHPQAKANPPPPKMKCVEVVRKRDQRECLPGFACSECEGYYRELERQGLLESADRAEALKRCSRHKGRWEPPQTPEGFWELSVHTPATWK